VQDLPFPPNSFDCAVAIGLFEYIDDIPQALCGLAGVLRPGGRLVVSVPHLASPYRLLRQPMVAALRAADGGVRAVLGRSQRMPRPWRRIRTPKGWRAVISSSPFEVTGTLCCAMPGAPYPIDEVAPRLSGRVARTFEPLCAAPLAAWLGTECVILARLGPGA
jgi:SAM-dependent methyltransferase